MNEREMLAKMTRSEVERWACEILARHIHAPFAEVTVRSFPDQPAHKWIGVWQIDGAWQGNIWFTPGDGWNVSINLPTQAATAMLRMMPVDDLALPTTVTVDQ